MNKISEWYSVKGLYRWYFKENGQTERIEERVVLFFASSFDHALDLAEAESKTYCTPDPEANYLIEPVGWWSAYWVGNQPANGVEIYSRCCTTELSSQAFVRRYYPSCHSAGG